MKLFGSLEEMAVQPWTKRIEPYQCLEDRQADKGSEKCEQEDKLHYDHVFCFYRDYCWIDIILANNLLTFSYM